MAKVDGKAEGDEELDENGEDEEDEEEEKDDEVGNILQTYEAEACAGVVANMELIASESFALLVVSMQQVSTQIYLKPWLSARWPRRCRHYERMLLATSPAHCNALARRYTSSGTFLPLLGLQSPFLDFDSFLSWYYITLAAPASFSSLLLNDAGMSVCSLSCISLAYS